MDMFDKAEVGCSKEYENLDVKCILALRQLDQTAGDNTKTDLTPS
jgi:hypothetical protein